MVAGWFAVLEIVEVLLGSGWHEFCSNTLVQWLRLQLNLHPLSEEEIMEGLGITLHKP
jgi:hypothetical protein